MLVVEADRRRRDEGLSMRRFAAELEVSTTLYSMTLRGRKPLDRKLARAIVARYEDLRPMAEREGAAHLLGV